MDINSPEAFKLNGSKQGILLIHGFTGTPQSVKWLGKRLHELTGATVHAPRLAGHGETPEELAKTGFRDWLASAENALHDLRKEHEQITVAGLSLGGTIALNIAIRFPNEIGNVVTINASTGLYSAQQMLAIFDDKPKAYHDGIGSDIKDPNIREICYEKIPCRALKERYILASATGQMLGLMSKPILIFQSREDHVVSPKNGKRIANSVASETVIFKRLKNSYHVATLDHDKEFIAQEISSFIELDLINKYA